MRPTKKLFFMECHIAGRQYHDASEVWDELKIGTPLLLERELDNHYDPEAVAIFYHKKSEDEYYKLGYIPGADNNQIAAFLEMGYSDIFEVRISSINPEAHYEQQLRIVIKIMRKQN